VLQALISGAIARLKPGGSLFLVAKEHVPVGLIIEATDASKRRFASVEMLFADGRFTVWRADTHAVGAAAAHVEDVVEGSKKKSKKKKKKKKQEGVKRT
jgi:hypothetical protein